LDDFWAKFDHIRPFFGFFGFKFVQNRNFLQVWFPDTAWRGQEDLRLTRNKKMQEKCKNCIFTIDKTYEL